MNVAYELKYTVPRKSVNLISLIEMMHTSTQVKIFANFLCILEEMSVDLVYVFTSEMPVYSTS